MWIYIPSPSRVADPAETMQPTHQTELLAEGEKYCSGPTCTLPRRIIPDSIPAYHIVNLAEEEYDICFFCLRRMNRDDHHTARFTKIEFYPVTPERALPS